MTAKYIDKSVGKDSGDPNELPCRKKGIFIQNIRIDLNNKAKCLKEGYTFLNDSLTLNDVEKKLLMAIRRGCNGKHECILMEAWNIRPNVSCNGSFLLIDEIKITYSCLPVNIDDFTVFDLNNTTSIILNNTSYLILKSKETQIEKVCEFSDNKNKHRLQVLHVDFSNEDSLNSSKVMKNANSIFTIKDLEKPVFTYRSSDNFFKHTDVAVDKATIEIKMYKGFLWLEDKADGHVNLTCRNKEIDDKSQPYSSESSLTTTIPIVIICIGGCLLLTCILVTIYRKKRFQKKSLSIPSKRPEYFSLELQPEAIENPQNDSSQTNVAVPFNKMSRTEKFGKVNKIGAPIHDSETYSNQG